ncbi:pentapeptide repeat-containing protein, partial [Ferrovibrio sp.]|uniref:pentapeptide repeat-containing protein n=1 Tax=Ferrovibrio sp. TaxID=1917215 RepID=UPI0025C5AB14
DCGGSRLSGANLAGTMFRGTRLVGVPIYSATNKPTGRVVFPRFDNADMGSCDLRGAVVEGVDFTSCKMAKANLAGADLRNCTGINTRR